jgi:hypothetical protein
MEKWKTLAEKNGIKRNVFWDRVHKLGWNPEKAATVSVGESKIRPDEEWIQKAEENNISKRAFIDRVDVLGWTHEKAATTPVKQVKPRKDREWIKVAIENGISKETYTKRVDASFWDPEEAATTPTMTNEESLARAKQEKAVYTKIKHDRINQDKNNLFKITPKHYEIAESNGICKGTVNIRVYRSGWTVQEAITIPPVKKIRRSKEYYDYLELAKKNHINSMTYLDRVKKGWTFHDAATIKPGTRKPNHRKRSDNVWMEKAIQNGIKPETYKSRIGRGWTPDEASTVPPLARGEFLNEKRKQNAIDGVRSWSSRKGG